VVVGLWGGAFVLVSPRCLGLDQRGGGALRGGGGGDGATYHGWVNARCVFSPFSPFYSKLALFFGLFFLGSPRPGADRGSLFSLPHLMFHPPGGSKVGRMVINSPSRGGEGRQIREPLFFACMHALPPGRVGGVGESKKGRGVRLEGLDGIW